MIKWIKLYKGDAWICTANKRIFRVFFEHSTEHPQFQEIQHYDVPDEVLMTTPLDRG
jgi:hypothetical protein